MKRALYVIATLIACGSSMPTLAAVTASVDRDHVDSGETVRLMLQHDGSDNGQPDVNPLKRDFDILSSSSGSSVKIINGNVSAKTQVALVLAPKHDGKLQVPSLQWNGEQSPALELTVGGKASATAQGAEAPNDASHVFFTTTLDHKQPYVQAAVVLTVRLYTDEPLEQASLDLTPSNDVLVQQLGKDKQSSEVRGDRNYQVIERKYLLFPQRSGQISLDGPVLAAQVQDASKADPFGDDGFFGSVFRRMQIAGMTNAMRPLRLHAKSIEMSVLPRPAAMTGSIWLPAQSVTLSEAWASRNASVHVGEPLTRHLHLEALGLTGAQLPDLSTLVSAPDGIKAYPDQSKVEDSTRGNTVSGRRDQDVALIANQAGHYTLPAVRLSWWDTTTNEQRDAVLPAHELDVLPAAAGSIAANVPPTTNSAPAGQKTIDLAGSTNLPVAKLSYPSPWVWSAVGFGVLWLGTALAWWFSRKKVASPPSETIDEQKPRAPSVASAFKSFQKACRDADQHAARRHLLEWASASWPTDPPAGLNALSRMLDDAKMSELLRQLDRSCYANGPWCGEELVQTFSRPAIRPIPTTRKEQLSELYP